MGVDLAMSEKEMLNRLLDELDMLFRIKYSDDIEKTLEREISSLKTKVETFNSVNIEAYESKYIK